MSEKIEVNLPGKELQKLGVKKMKRKKNILT